MPFISVGGITAPEHWVIEQVARCVNQKKYVGRMRALTGSPIHLAMDFLSMSSSFSKPFCASNLVYTVKSSAIITCGSWLIRMLYGVPVQPRDLLPRVGV